MSEMSVRKELVVKNGIRSSTPGQLPRNSFNLMTIIPQALTLAAVILMILWRFHIHIYIRFDIPDFKQI